MICPECGGKSNIVDQVNVPDGDVYRRHKCKVCGVVFHTVEYPIIENDKFKNEWKKHYRKSKKKEEL
jgi:transcriptional regulator NrdR family protein